MKDATRLLAIVCALWCARSDGGKPSSGYCIGNQCFTASEQPETFVAAQKECEGLGGHLMTVRTSVSHDVLSLLLGNVSGRFWIGLHLPTGCPDGSLELNGFSWVPGGSESDFSNWPAAFDGSCSSDRCVSVSPVDDFKWTREPCDARAAGFLCEFGFNVTCRGLGAGAGGTPTYSTPIGIEGGELLSLPPGSVAVLMPSGSKYICFSGGWVEAPWTCEVLGGGCEHRCTLDPEQMPLCYCPRGQTVNPENQVTCEEAQGDPCAALRCAHACYDNGGSHACKCRQGFKLAADGRSCVDVDECVSAPCEHECKNSPGSYKCACYSGYRVDAKEPHRCQLHCEERECAAECDPNDRFTCYCPEGFILEERDPANVCVDMDECTFSRCQHQCENTHGGFACACSPGYQLVGDYDCVETGEEPEGSGDSGVTAEPEGPGPTGPPFALPAGGLVGIFLGALVFIALLVFLACRVVCGRKRMESEEAVKAPGDEGHNLRPLTSDA